MSNRIDRYCKTCGNVTVADAGYYAGSSFYQCETCGRRGMSDIFPQATVFHKLTASPEVLAEKLVYVIKQLFTISGTSRGNLGEYEVKTKWFSTIVDGDFDSEPEAIAATLKKLNEVEE